jgi:uroporphyrinogen-III synthase
MLLIVILQKYTIFATLLSMTQSNIFLLNTRQSDSSIMEAIQHHPITLMDDPMITKSMLSKPIAFDENNYDGFITTSTFAIDVLSIWSMDRHKPMYCVGSVSASHAHDLGFENIIMGTGNVHSLIPLIPSNFFKPLLYIKGDVVRYELTSLINDPTICIQTMVGYTTLLCETLKPKTINHLKQKKIKGILFFSPRSAQNFVKLLSKDNISLDGIICFCLSHDVASPIINMNPMEIIIPKTIDNNCLIKEAIGRLIP